MLVCIRHFNSFLNCDISADIPYISHNDNVQIDQMMPTLLDVLWLVKKTPFRMKIFESDPYVRKISAEISVISQLFLRVVRLNANACTVKTETMSNKNVWAKILKWQNKTEIKIKWKLNRNI